MVKHGIIEDSKLFERNRKLFYYKKIFLNRKVIYIKTLKSIFFQQNINFYNNKIEINKIEKFTVNVIDNIYVYTCIYFFYLNILFPMNYRSKK